MPAVDRVLDAAFLLKPMQIARGGARFALEIVRIVAAVFTRRGWHHLPIADRPGLGSLVLAMRFGHEQVEIIRGDALGGQPVLHIVADFRAPLSIMRIVLCHRRRGGGEGKQGGHHGQESPHASLRFDRKTTLSAIIGG